MTDTILYFGSFNPVHHGHTAIAQWVAGRGYGEVWLVVSPRNPLKNSDILAPDADRLQMVRLALEGIDGVGACDIEFSLPKPSYTIDTLDVLRAKYPDRRFAVLIGADILPELDRWKDHERILNEYRVLVYPRAGADIAQSAFAERITQLSADAPLLDVSSTEIRARLARGEDCSELVEANALEYIDLKGLYQGAEALMQRGRAFFKANDLGAALNAFRRVDTPEAREYVAHIQEILDFRHTDIYNP